MQKNEKIKVLCQLGSFFDSYCNNHAEIKDNKFFVVIYESTVYPGLTEEYCAPMLEKISKLNFMVEFLKIVLKSKLLSENLSGIYKDFNNAKFNNLKLSNILNDLNNLRFDYFKVPQINENHVFNYYFSELKNSIKL